VETFGLTANLRRAAASVAMNIAEGAGRGTRRDFIHFVDIARGSLFETLASFILAERLGYISASALDTVRKDAETLGRKLSSFKKSLNDHKP
jgi:four helix bundle protein